MLNNQDFTHDRTKYLGGSDIGPILGLSQYRTAVDVWLEKTGQVQTTIDNLPLRFGTFAETFVASEYCRQTGFTVAPQTQAITHDQHPFLAAHIDRFVFTQDAQEPINPSHLLECKTANPFGKSEWGEIGSDEVPMTYLAQCHWYLALTQLERCDLAVLFGNSELRIYRIEKDAELESVLIEQAVHFWEQCVVKMSAPNPQTISDYQALFPAECVKKAVQADIQTAKLITYYQELNELIRAKEAEQVQIKQHIMAAMQDAQELIYEGQILASWKRPKPSLRFDSKRFELEHPDLFPCYQVPIANSRRLLIKESKAANNPHVNGA
jgi:putative phage-type endonuclease